MTKLFRKKKKKKKKKKKTKKKKKKKKKLTNFRRNSMRAYSRTFALKMEAEYSFETLITT